MIEKQHNHSENQTQPETMKFKKNLIMMMTKGKYYVLLYKILYR